MKFKSLYTLKFVPPLNDFPPLIFTLSLYLEVQGRISGVDEGKRQ